MEKIININLSGRLIPIEDTAYETLKKYLDSLARHFEKEEGGEEIVSDIEDRIGELFQERLKKGASCITDKEVAAMIATIGRPEQLEDETSTEPQEKYTDSGRADSASRNEAPRRLTRNRNDKVIGGVCSGIANYLNIDPTIVRIITVILVLFYGVGVLAYIIMWLVLPSENKENVETKGLRRRLYRDSEHRVIGGVASGIASYFKISPVIPRIIFLLPLIGMVLRGIFWAPFRHFPFNHTIWWNQEGFASVPFGFPFSTGFLPVMILLYIILWIVVPKAVTPAEKLDMKGEKVDLQNLSNAYKSAEGEKKKVNERGEFSSVQNAAVEKSGCLTAIGVLFKIFAFFVLGIIIIAIGGILVGVIGVLFGIGAFSSSFLFPLKSIILGSGLQNILVWPAVILTFGIPVVALLWILVRWIRGSHSRFRFAGMTFLILWLAGLICAVALVVNVLMDFRAWNNYSSEITFSQPEKTLVLKMKPLPSSAGNIFSHQTFFSFNISDEDDFWPGEGVIMYEDTLNVATVRYEIEQSDDSLFRISVIRSANGRTPLQARQNTNHIHFHLIREDSVLYIPQMIKLEPGTPFRNQRVLVKIFVPKDKKVKAGRDLKKLRKDRDDDWDDFDDFFN